MPATPAHLRIQVEKITPTIIFVVVVVYQHFMLVLIGISTPFLLNIDLV
jgi:hypothetical protein